MKKRVLIFLLLIMVNTLPIYAMYSPQNQCGRTMGKNLSSGTGSCLTGDSDSDSDSDEEPSMPTLGDDSDGEKDAFRRLDEGKHVRTGDVPGLLRLLLL